MKKSTRSPTTTAVTATIDLQRRIQRKTDAKDRKQPTPKSDKSKGPTKTGGAKRPASPLPA